MSAWIAIGLIIVVIDLAVIGLFLYIARRGLVVDEEPLSMDADPAPPPSEPYVRLVPRFAIVLAAGVAAYAWLPPAEAQQPCGPHDHIVAQLKARYGESFRSLGLQSNGLLLKVYVAMDGETWTIVSTRPQDGLTCVVAAGKWWEDLPPPVVEIPIRLERRKIAASCFKEH